MCKDGTAWGDKKDEATGRADGTRNLGRVLFGRGIICLLARLWWPSVCRDPDGLFALIARGISPGSPPDCGWNGGSVGCRQRVRSGRLFIPRLPDVSDGPEYLRTGKGRDHGRTGFCASRVGAVGERRRRGR